MSCSDNGRVLGYYDLFLTVYRLGQYLWRGGQRGLGGRGCGRGGGGGGGKISFCELVASQSLTSVIVRTLTMAVKYDELFFFFFFFFAGRLTSQQHASVSQGRICSDNFTLCHT